MKKIFYGFAVLAIAVVAALNVSINSHYNNLSGIAVSENEALANNENPTGSCHCTKRCDDYTVVSCTGYTYCRCNAGFHYVVCDDIYAYC